MCTINMTFEVPEARAIDIDALKQNMQAYFNLLVSFPSILKKDNSMSESLTDQMLERFAGCWHGEESTEEIMDIIKETRQIRKPLSL